MLTTIEYANLSTYAVADSKLAYNWYPPYRPDYIKLTRGCPVHPDGPLPHEVFDRWVIHRSLSLNPPAADFAWYHRQATAR